MNAAPQHAGKAALGRCYNSMAPPGAVLPFFTALSRDGEGTTMMNFQRVPTSGSSTTSCTSRSTTSIDSRERRHSPTVRSTDHYFLFGATPEKTFPKGTTTTSSLKSRRTPSSSAVRSTYCRKAAAISGCFGGAPALAEKMPGFGTIFSRESSSEKCNRSVLISCKDQIDHDLRPLGVHLKKDHSSGTNTSPLSLLQEVLLYQSHQKYVLFEIDEEAFSEKVCPSLKGEISGLTEGDEIWNENLPSQQSPLHCSKQAWRRQLYHRRAIRGLQGLGKDECYRDRQQSDSDHDKGKDTSWDGRKLKGKNEWAWYRDLRIKRRERGQVI